MKQNQRLKEKLEHYLEENRSVYYKMSDQVWDFAELAYKEKQTSRLQAEHLERAGFSVTRNAGGVPQAVVAEYGRGKPVIGLFGELDALPSMSQKPDLSRQEPLEEGGAGHACGHHLLGTASLAAAEALKAVMKEEAIYGTVRYYGCPAEEYGSGKVYMARAGLFDDVDIALGWHPFSYTCLGNTGWQANLMVRYIFHGISANPAHSGHLGRSALDAAELMGVGVQYLREHVLPDVRIHYAYQDAGGVAPNVIPSKVSVNYFIRASHIADARQVKARVDQIAQGAALMTGTHTEDILHNGMADYQKNEVVDRILLNNMREVPMPEFTEEELAYGKQFRQVTDGENIRGYQRHVQRLLGLTGQSLEQEMEKPVSQLIFPESIPVNGSSDFGDVSQIVPAGQFLATCFTIGCPCHSWQACAEGKSAIAHKGELYAAKVLAWTAADFFLDADAVQRARQEFEKIRNKEVYECVIPSGTEPHGYEF